MELKGKEGFISKLFTKKPSRTNQTARNKQSSNCNSNNNKTGTKRNKQYFSCSAQPGEYGNLQAIACKFFSFVTYVKIRRTRSLNFSMSMLWLEIFIAFSINHLPDENKKNEKAAVSLLRAFSYPNYFGIVLVTGNNLNSIWPDLVF